MMNTQDVQQATLLTAVSVAEDDPIKGLEILEGLNTEFGFSLDPDLAPMYKGAVKVARKGVATIKDNHTLSG